MPPLAPDASGVFWHGGTQSMRPLSVDRFKIRGHPLLARGRSGLGDPNEAVGQAGEIAGQVTHIRPAAVFVEVMMFSRPVDARAEPSVRGPDIAAMGTVEVDGGTAAALCGHGSTGAGTTYGEIG